MVPTTTNTLTGAPVPSVTEQELSHPKNHALLGRVMNALIDAGVFVATAGHVKLDTNVTLDPNPIENGNLVDGIGKS